MEIAALIVSVIAIGAVAIEIYLNHFAKPPFARIYVSEFCTDAEPPDSLPEHSPPTEWFEVTAIIANPRKADLLVKDASIFCAKDVHADEYAQEISFGLENQSAIRIAPGSIESLIFKMRFDVIETTLTNRQQVPILHVRLLTPDGEAVVSSDIGEMFDEPPSSNLWQVIDVNKIGEVKVGPTRHLK